MFKQVVEYLDAMKRTRKTDPTRDKKKKKKNAMPLKITLGRP